MNSFSALIPGSTPVSLLESESGFETVTPLADFGKVPSSHLQSMAKTEVILASLKERLGNHWRLVGLLELDRGTRQQTVAAVAVNQENSLPCFYTVVESHHDVSQFALSSVDVADGPDFPLEVEVVQSKLSV